jgi:hypothetical protein
MISRKICRDTYRVLEVSLQRSHLFLCISKIINHLAELVNECCGAHRKLDRDSWNATASGMRDRKDKQSTTKSQETNVNCGDLV